jgi:hypothetical protein
VQLSVFRTEYQVHSLEHLRSLLGYRHKDKYGAFWLAKGERGEPALALFINGDQACMFYIREECDTGFHSLGAEPENFTDEVDFVIDNYQLDQYPRAMVVPASQGIKAIEEFFETATMPTAVRWFEV